MIMILSIQAFSTIPWIKIGNCPQRRGDGIPDTLFLVWSPWSLRAFIACSIYLERISPSSINKYSESGSPCQSPRISWILVFRFPFTNTQYVGMVMHARVHWIHFHTKLCFSRILSKNSHSTRLYAFCISTFRAYSIFLPPTLCCR